MHFYLDIYEYFIYFTIPLIESKMKNQSHTEMRDELFNNDEILE